jgi:hypothetical protein
VQLRTGQPEEVDALPRPAAITIVEEDDVAFTLSLCREVHRIYSRYQEGGMETSESLEAGLALTVEMLAMLSASVDAGMPAMRIVVAAAEVTEMLAVMFDHDWSKNPAGARLRERHLALIKERLEAAGPPALDQLDAPAGFRTESPPGSGDRSHRSVIGRLFRRRRR